MLCETAAPARITHNPTLPPPLADPLFAFGTNLIAGLSADETLTRAQRGASARLAGLAVRDVAIRRLGAMVPKQPLHVAIIACTKALDTGMRARQVDPLADLDPHRVAVATAYRALESLLVTRSHRHHGRPMARTLRPTTTSAR